MKKLFLPLALVAIMSYSCKKSGLNPSTKLLIASEAVTDYYPADSTFSFTVNFQYDNNNRLSTVTHNYGPRYYINTSNYSYNSNGNLVQLVYLQGSATYGTYTYNYDNGGIPVNTSYLAPNSTNPITEAGYTITGGHVTGINFPASSDELTETITYNGNNYNELRYNDGTTYTYIYGNHHSQFEYTGLKYCFYELSYVINDNEILDIKEVNSSGVTSDVKNVYTYNSNGYPLKEQTYNNGTLAESVVYTYTEFKE